MRFPRLGLLVLVLGLSSVSTNAAIKLEGRRITASPDKKESILGQRIEVLDAVDCKTVEKSSPSMDLPENCAYLHGLYRYIYVPKGEKKKHQVLADFAVTRNGAKGFSLLVNDSIEFDEENLSLPQ